MKDFIQSERKEVFFRILGFYRPYWKYVILSIPCAVLVSIVPGSSAALIKPLIDNVFISRNQQLLGLIAVAVVGLYLIKGLARFGQGYLLRIAGQKAVRDVRNVLFRHIHSLSRDFFDRADTGALISRLNYDVFLLQMIAQAAVDLIKEPLTLLWLLGLMFYLDWKLSLAALIVLPPAGWFVWFLAGRVRAASRAGQEYMENLTARMQESFAGSHVVKAFGAEREELRRFEEENERFLQSMVGVIRYTEMLSPAVEFLGALGICAVIYYGGMRVLEDGIYTPGRFFAFLGAVGMMYEPYRKLSRLYAVLQQAIAAGGRIFSILDMQPSVQNPPEPAPWTRFEKEIRFENVRFSYGARPALKGVSFTITAGSVVGIAGEVGSGKSTIAHLIMRYYDVTDGQILVDGYDIRELRIEALRSNVALISQDVFLFNDTVKENIRYGRPDAHDEEIVEAAKLAGIHEFILTLPHGYDTLVGERGVHLSGGQRQKISIARAFLKNAPLLILDEATSNLDVDSENEVEDAIFRLIKGKTVIIITHRLPFLEKADKIIVMKEGLIMEEGSHQELMAAGGYYASLVGRLGAFSQEM